jgi:hypothetical protein
MFFLEESRKKQQEQEVAVSKLSKDQVIDIAMPWEHSQRTNPKARLLLLRKGRRRPTLSIRNVEIISPLVAVYQRR